MKIGFNLLKRRVIHSLYKTNYNIFVTLITINNLLRLDFAQYLTATNPPNSINV